MLDHQRTAVGHLAIAVAVAVHIAEHVQQRLRLGHVVLACDGAQARIVPGNPRAVGGLRRDRLVLADDRDLVLGFVGERDGAPQRHLLRRVPAHDGILHVVEVVGEIERRHLLHLDPALGEVRRELVVGHALVGELLGHLVHQVHLLVQEREPARLRLLDDGNLDAPDHRQSLALHPGEDFLPALVVGRGLPIEVLLAIVGIGLEHHLRGPFPEREPVRARAHRMGADVLAVLLHHLARHGAGDAAVGEVVDEDVERLGELHLEGVAVQRLQPLDGRVVVEPVGLARLFNRLGAAHDVALDLPELRSAQLRIEHALDRVDVILSGELALAAVEHRVVGEVDAGPYSEGIGKSVGADLRQPLEGVGLELRGPREVGVVQGRVEHRAVHDVRVEVAHPWRVECGLRDLEGVAEHLCGIGRVGGRGGCEQEQGQKRFHGPHCPYFFAELTS